MSIKNIIVFGAHGKVGQQIIKLAGASGFQSTAIVRNSTQGATVTQLAENVTTKELTVDSASVEELANSIKGHEAVIISMGSAGKNLLQVDLDGTVKLFEASVQAQVRRLVLVSAAKAEDREWFSKTGLRNYYIAKHYADRILINEFKDSLDFTIVKPGSLADGSATGKIKLIDGDISYTETVNRADVAQVILNVLDKPNSYGKSYDFVNGDEEIDQLIK